MKHLKLYEEFKWFKNNQVNEIDPFDEEDWNEQEEKNGNQYIVQGENENQYTVKEIKKILRNNSRKLNNCFRVDITKWTIPREFSYTWGEKNDFINGLFVNFFKTTEKMSKSNIFITITDNRPNSWKMIKQHLTSPHFFSWDDFRLKLKFNTVENAIDFLNDCNLNTDEIL